MATDQIQMSDEEYEVALANPREETDEERKANRQAQEAQEAQKKRGVLNSVSQIAGGVGSNINNYLRQRREQELADRPYKLEKEKIKLQREQIKNEERRISAAREQAKAQAQANRPQGSGLSSLFGGGAQPYSRPGRPMSRVSRQPHQPQMFSNPMFASSGFGNMGTPNLGTPAVGPLNFPTPNMSAFNLGGGSLGPFGNQPVRPRAKARKKTRRSKRR